MTHDRIPNARVHREVQAPAAAVWQVLTDGWTYANWVVGASRVRDVEPQWPQVGSRIHHAFGPWPVVLQDSTIVERSEPERVLVLKARGWPVGEARVALRIDPITDESCRLEIVEDAVAGPGRWAIPRALRQLAIAPRNRESLYRLGLIAEGRHRNAKVPGSSQAHNAPGVDGLEGHPDAGSSAASSVEGSAPGRPPTDRGPAVEPMAI